MSAPLLSLSLGLLGCGADPMAVALERASELPFQVWVFTAETPDGPWTGSRAPLAGGVSSLGLHVEPDGRLALTGLPMVEPPLLEELFPSLRVRGWTATARLTRAEAGQPSRWTPAAWPVEDPEAVAAVDPQGLEGGFWYFAAVGRGGDPAKAQGAHRLRSSPPAQARLLGEGLADPSPARFRGEILLFATAHPDSVVVAAGEPLAEIARFPGVSVPFARVIAREGAEELLLLAQAALDGRRQPVLSRSADGRSWSPWQRVIDLGARGSCTSPVLGKLVDGWMLACVEEPGR